MKNLLLSFIFISFSLAMNAQENETSIIDNQVEESITENNDFLEKPASETVINTDNQTVKLDKICYSEVSKVAFYEALLSQNDFKINLKNSTDLAIKNTEEIITRKIDEILYSEED
ncbi:hypothetical protein [Aquimarina sp. 2201CG14-23]|uniref:hypothetical protein n=1 Tax=Aquimarina mycalae TaxID=3040073 RepID=UPI00247814E6|nr:hypothetical protein [Aquimarina sp. 2201CG14-23]MDH7445321.1 hypothetical protein [Aquimarina sp. 2201CG14-23]